MEIQPETTSSLQQETGSLLSSNRELAVLYAITGQLNRKVDVHEALQEVLAQVTKLLGLETGWVWLLNEQGERRLDLPEALEHFRNRDELKS